MDRIFRALLIGLAVLLAASAQAGTQCSARSGPGTAALVELYTSEGCNSCPPADRWLSSLASRGYAGERVVPIALHVDYWDYLGWKDPFARARFSERQRRLAQLQHSHVVYTPQVLLQGEDFRSWDGPRFAAAVARINGLPAAARIALGLERAGRDALRLDVRAELADPAAAADAGLYLAAYGNGLVSRVAAGENEGRTLAHDHVALSWIGPLAFGANGRLHVERALSQPTDTRTREFGFVAFVQDRLSGKVLQALMLPAC
jgi:hypothetical protein